MDIKNLLLVLIAVLSGAFAAILINHYCNLTMTTIKAIRGISLIIIGYAVLMEMISHDNSLGTLVINTDVPKVFKWFYLAGLLLTSFSIFVV